LAYRNKHKRDPNRIHLGLILDVSMKRWNRFCNTHTHTHTQTRTRAHTVRLLESLVR